MSRRHFKFHPDFTSFTKVIYLFKKELRIKAKVKDLHKKELGLDFYFKIFASSRYLLSLSAFAAGAQRGGNQKILISDFSGFPTSLDNGGYSQQSPKTLTTGKPIKTGFKLMVTLQSGCVPEILTLCRMNKIFFKKNH